MGLGYQDIGKLEFIKIGPENTVLWTGMKGVSAKSRKSLNQMLKRVQHDNRVRVSFFCHPELVSGSRFLVLRIWVLKPRPYMLNYPNSPFLPNSSATFERPSLL